MALKTFIEAIRETMTEEMRRDESVILLGEDVGLKGGVFLATDGLFAEFLQKLAATKEGDGTLLDHSLYLYGSGIGNPNVHDHTNLPIIVAGGAGGGGAGLKGNRHIRFSRTTPLANLHLTLLDKVGVHLDKFADSDGHVDELFEPVGI